MRLALADIWSPDLNPASSGVPPSLTDFNVYVNIAVSSQGPGRECFDFFVRSPNFRDEPGLPALRQSLTLPCFEWANVRLYVEEKLRDIGRSATTWDQALRLMAPYFHSMDHELEGE
jgi:hypothetical protein